MLHKRCLTGRKLRHRVVEKCLEVAPRRLQQLLSLASIFNKSLIPLSCPNTRHTFPTPTSMFLSGCEPRVIIIIIFLYHTLISDLSKWWKKLKVICCKNWIGHIRILWNSRLWLQHHSSLRYLDQTERKSGFSGIACVAQNDWGNGWISGFLVHAPRDERDSHLQVNSLLFLA